MSSAGPGRSKYQAVVLNDSRSTTPMSAVGTPPISGAGSLQSDESLRLRNNSPGNDAAQDLGPYSHIQKGSMRGMSAQGPYRNGNGGARDYNTRGRTGSIPTPAFAAAASVATTSLSDQSGSSQKNSSGSVSERKLLFDGGSKGSYLSNDMEAEEDDYLHNPDGRRRDTKFICCSSRGFLNFLALFAIVAGLLALFAGYPIISHFARKTESTQGAFNIGGTNGTGQVPVVLPQMQLRDSNTPVAARRWTSPIDRTPYHLVFSDEFEEEGRTFWPGDDPFWEAQNIWYGATGDYEWYSPEQINTTNGHLQITLEAKPLNNLNFRSGMLTSWNKFCFQGGYLEFSAILPGSPRQVGWWPGLWTMGNLARPGYLGTTDGMWPYSYDSCDSGILINQTAPGRPGYSTVSTFRQYGQTGLSWLNGMRTPSCTCPGEDHPGPNNNVGRSAPELDVLEAQIKRQSIGEASQSLQVAPFDPEYEIDQTHATIHSPDTVAFNTYKGGVYQQAGSAVAEIPDTAYTLTGNRFTTFGVDYRPDFAKRGRGTITWYLDGKPTWTVEDAAFPPRPAIDIGQRFAPVEPMAIIMNLGISRGFQADLDFDTLTYPAVLRVDYVRVYQPDSYENDMTSCDPPDYPTAKYIQEHIEVYNNPNYTTWPKSFSKNRITGC